MSATPDEKRGRRIRDPELVRELHLRWRGSCALDELGDCDEARYGLHHIHNKPRDDVEANLVMLCGDGVRGHHGLVTVNDYAACRALGIYIVLHRLDTMAYLGEKLGGPVAAAEWMRRQLYWGDVVIA